MERVIQLEGANNFRDMGGYAAADGRRVRCGMLFRSDHLARVTDRDLKRLEGLGIRTILDLRSQAEIAANPDRLNAPRVFPLDPFSATAEAAAAAGAGEKLEDENRRLVHRALQMTGEELRPENSPVYQMYRSLVREPAPQAAYARLIDLLCDKSTPAMVMHCRGGKDRTGYGAAIIHYLLGVSMDDLVEDYLLTGCLRQKRNAFKMEQYRALTRDQRVLDYLYMLIDTRRAFLTGAFDEMTALCGSPDAYLEDALGVTPEKKQALRDLYLGKDI